MMEMRWVFETEGEKITTRVNARNKVVHVVQSKRSSDAQRGLGVATLSEEQAATIATHLVAAGLEAKKQAGAEPQMSPKNPKS